MTEDNLWLYILLFLGLILMIGYKPIGNLMSKSVHYDWAVRFPRSALPESFWLRLARGLCFFFGIITFIYALLKLF
jgi:nitric oxide reductase large subunit